MNITEAVQRGDHLFTKRSGLLSLWQTIGENFCPHRADFTVTRSLGTDFSEHLTSSYPPLVSRDLGDSISSILRPDGEQWFEISTERENKLNNGDKRWLEMAGKTQHSALYNIRSGFVRSTKEVDHDFANFGQGVISSELNWAEHTLLHRSYHLKNVVWAEDNARMICEVHNKWPLTAKYLVNHYRDKCDQKLIELAKTEPYRDIDCRHMVMEADDYYGGTAYKKRFKQLSEDEKLYVSVIMDVENSIELEVVQRKYLGYVIPRFKTITGSQYAFSPATMIALADARTIQAMALSLLEAGEMVVRPPLMAVPDAIREDIQYRAGGITKIDIEADQQLKNILAPILGAQGGGINYGLEMVKDIRDLMASAFYINKLMLPVNDGKKTAYEISELISEHNRQVTPLFEPLLSDYNGQLMELDFQLLMGAGAFGPPQDIPPNLRKQEIKWKFKNPLQDSADKKKGTILQMGIQLTAEAMQLDPNVSAMWNLPVALRDALEGMGTSANNLQDEDTEQAILAQRKQQQQQAQALQMAMAGGQAAESIGKGGKELEGVM